jgi:hypothetical protein
MDPALAVRFNEENIMSNKVSAITGVFDDTTGALKSISRDCGGASTGTPTPIAALSTAQQAAIDAGGSSVVVNSSGVLVDKNLSPVSGAGDLPVNGVVVGREYLHDWYRGLIASPLTTRSITLSGDSTTVGYVIADNQQAPAGALRNALARRGVLANVTASGWSGENSSQWLATRLPADLAGSAPGIYVIRWGMNDPSTGVSLSQTLANITAGVALIRATGSWSATRILLMTPNTSSDDINARNEAVWRTWRRPFYDLSKTLGLAFVDTFGLLPEARNRVTIGGSNFWLDAASVHPGAEHEMLIQAHVADLLAPSIVLDYMAEDQAVTPGSGFGLGAGVEAPKSRLAGGVVTLIGYLTSPSSVTPGQNICTIAARHRPSAGVLRAWGYSYNGGPITAVSTFPEVPLQILPDGTVNSLSAVSGISRVYIAGLSYAR